MSEKLLKRCLAAAKELLTTWGEDEAPDVLELIADIKIAIADAKIARLARQSLPARNY